MFKLYFIDYAITVVLIFPPLSPSTQHHPHSLRQFPHNCSCPQIMRVSSVATPFPILHFTSPWLFCNYLFVLLNPFTSSPILLLPPLIWQPLVTSFFPLAFKSLFIINLWPFIMMCLGVGLFASIIIGTLCAS